MKLIPIRHIATAKNEINNAGRFNIREVQTVLNGKDLVHPLHKHDFFFVLALQKGKGIHEIDFVKYSIPDSVVFILRPGQVHQLQLQAPCTGYLMEFDTAFYQPKNSITDQRWRKAVSKSFCGVEVSRFTKLLTILSNIFNEYTTKEKGYVQAITANLDLFFLEYIRQSQNPNSSENTNSYTQDRFEELVDLLETNICSVKDVSTYANLLNLSPYQLNAITKASVGKTVSSLINEQIVLEAKRYLMATANQIKDVADHLGYEDASYFIRFFRKHTGQSPEGFRKNFK